MMTSSTRQCLDTLCCYFHSLHDKTEITWYHILNNVILSVSLGHCASGCGVVYGTVTAHA